MANFYLSVGADADFMEILDDIEYPFPKFTVTESTVRPYPVMVINYNGNLNNVLVKAEPAPGYKFKMENHIAHFKTKDQNHIQKSVGKIIVFEELQISDIGNAEGEPVQIDFSLYSIDGVNSTLLATKRSQIITVFNHSQYLPAPDIIKLLPEYCFVDEQPNVDAFGPLFLRKNNILECQVSEDTGKEFKLLTGKDIVRKRNCFHSFTFTAPKHKEGFVSIRARYKNRDFGTGKSFFYINQPTSNDQKANPLEVMDPRDHGYDNSFPTGNRQDIKTEDSFNNMSYYSYQGNYDGLRHALVMKPNSIGVNHTDKYGMTCLHWASLGGHTKCVQLLLEKGANPNIVSLFSETPLHIASRLGFSEIVTILIEYDAHVRLPTRKNVSSLHCAAMSGSCSILQMILDSEDGDSLINQYDSDRLTALHYAVMKGQYKAVKFLLEYANDLGEDLLLGDAHKMTPLHWAVALGEIECVRELLEHCDERQVNLKDESGRTALFYSVCSSSIEICRELLNHKADPNAQDNIKETPLFEAVESSGDVVSLLLEFNADPNIRNANNEKPFKVEKTTSSITPTPMPDSTPTPRSKKSVLPSPSDLLDYSKHREETVQKKQFPYLKKGENLITPEMLTELLEMPKQMKRLEQENEDLRSTIKKLEAKVQQLFVEVSGMPL